MKRRPWHPTFKRQEPKHAKQGVATWRFYEPGFIQDGKTVLGKKVPFEHKANQAALAYFLKQVAGAGIALIPTEPEIKKYFEYRTNQNREDLVGIAPARSQSKKLNKRKSSVRADTTSLCDHRIHCLLF